MRVGDWVTGSLLRTRGAQGEDVMTLCAAGTRPLKSRGSGPEQAVSTLEESTRRSHIKEAKLSASKKKGNILSQAMLWQKCKFFACGCQSPVSMVGAGGLTR